MNARQRFLDTLNFRKPADRLPMIEWAAWWNKTVERWSTEGLETEGKSSEDLQEYFGLDVMVMIRGAAGTADCPKPAYHGAPIIESEEDYENILPCLYPDSIITQAIERARNLKRWHEKGDVVVRLWLDGFFWFPRKLFGIEPHMYAFYDKPDLMHRMNADLAKFSIRLVDELFAEFQPDMVGFAEDMSYNNGPMLSEAAFEEFLTPYYQQVIPHIKSAGVKVLVDSDGDITSMIPWMRRAGIEGVYPLERQAGVDLNVIRRNYPDFLLLGGYDKMVMFQSEEAMQAEFDRLLPVMRSGGYIPSVDHQTPPQVSLDQYRTYLRLFDEYSVRAAREE